MTHSNLWDQSWRCCQFGRSDNTTIKFIVACAHTEVSRTQIFFMYQNMIYVMTQSTSYLPTQMKPWRHQILTAIHVYVCPCTLIHVYSKIGVLMSTLPFETGFLWAALVVSQELVLKECTHHCSPVFAISICLSLLPKCECLNSNNCPIHFSHSQLSVIHTKETCMHGPHSRPEVINLVTCRLFLSLFFLLLLSFIFQ